MAWLSCDGWSANGAASGKEIRGLPDRSATSIPYLDGKYIRSQGPSVYPKQEKNPKGEVHARLDPWSFDKARGSIVFRQFDTLGFVGTYVLDKTASEPDRWVLVAESLENVPKGWKARYVFTRKSDDEYHEMLELDPDSEGLSPIRHQPLSQGDLVSARRIAPKRLRYCAAVRPTLRWNNRPKKPASS